MHLFYDEPLAADAFDSTTSVASIRRIGLGAPHEVLVTIIRKTFFQKGSGRKEEALLRGLGQISSNAITDRIMRIVMRDGILTRFRGDEGWVYSPVREHAGRMKKMLQELNASLDPLWLTVGTI